MRISIAVETKKAGEVIIMCGINGILWFNEQEAISRDKPEQLLQKMCNRMLHRGPDNQGIYINRQAGLGFRRLSIIDCAGADQPISNEDDTVHLICNGEIYNYRTLRQELERRGHFFKTKGDAETILHLYEEYGFDCVEHLRGMFAFILWDQNKKLLFGARDHFGIKPFYYTYDHRRLVCSSEIKSILSLPDEDWEMDVQGLYHYLSFQYVPEPRTMIHGIKKLPAGHRLIAEGSDLRIEAYWQPQFQPQKQSPASLVQKVKDTFAESVQLHLESDVPIGCFLSSGIDSTAISAKASQLKSIHTFSVGFEGQYNELAYSLETAKWLQTEHHQWQIGEEDYFSALPLCIYYQDDPVADPSAVALFLVSKMASEYVKVVLSGEGADELFGGYRIYQEPLALQYVDWLPASMKSRLNQVLRDSPAFYGKNYLLRATTPLEGRFIGNAKIFTDDLKDILSCQLQDNQKFMQDAFEWTQSYYQQITHLDEVSKMQTIDLRLWLTGNILAKADKMSMAHSLELRVPFLDREMFRIAQTIPPELKVNRKTTKILLREALKELLPPHIINRPKLGFPVPLSTWLRGRRGQECWELIQASGIDSYINLSYIESLIRKHQRGEGDYARKIWSIYILAQWYMMYMKKSGQALSETLG